MNTILSYLVISSAYAQLPLPPTITPASSGTKFIDFICDVLFKWVFTIAIILSIAFILIAAFRYMTSSGAPEKITAANKTLIFAAVGIAVAILARTLPIMVGSFLADGLTLDPCPATTTTTDTDTGS